MMDKLIVIIIDFISIKKVVELKKKELEGVI